MWVYNSTELMHYGVKGMKWGVRKKLPTSDIRKAYDTAKKEKRVANRVYSRAFNRTASNPLNSVTKKGDKRWDDVVDKANAANRADQAYAQAKRARKEALKSTTKQLRKEATLADRLVYNDATRKKAAKYVVDNNMSVADATKKAQGDAWRNTAIFVAAYGGLAAASLYVANR
jgi:hypothetical protein